MARLFFITGSLFAGIGVTLGAFGAHAAKGKLPPERLGILHTGVRYQVIHALGLLAASWAAVRWPSPLVTAAGWTMAAGIVLFSGSLYLLAFTESRRFGRITPVGGLCFLAGWILLALGAW